MNVQVRRSQSAPPSTAPSQGSVLEARPRSLSVGSVPRAQADNDRMDRPPRIGPARVSLDGRSATPASSHSSIVDVAMGADVSDLALRTGLLGGLVQPHTRDTRRLAAAAGDRAQLQSPTPVLSPSHSDPVDPDWDECLLPGVSTAAALLLPAVQHAPAPGVPGGVTYSFTTEQLLQMMMRIDANSATSAQTIAALNTRVIDLTAQLDAFRTATAASLKQMQESAAEQAKLMADQSERIKAQAQAIAALQATLEAKTGALTAMENQLAELKRGVEGDSTAAKADMAQLRQDVLNQRQQILGLQQQLDTLNHSMTWMKYLCGGIAAAGLAIWAAPLAVPTVAAGALAAAAGAAAVAARP